MKVVKKTEKKKTQIKQGIFSYVVRENDNTPANDGYN